METDYLSYPHRCRNCEYANELKNYKAGITTYECERTGPFGYEPTALTS